MRRDQGSVAVTGKYGRVYVVYSETAVSSART